MSDKVLPYVHYNLKPATSGWLHSGAYHTFNGRNSPTLRVYDSDYAARMRGDLSGAKYNNEKSFYTWTNFEGTTYNRWRATVNYIDDDTAKTTLNSTTKGKFSLWGSKNLCSRKSADCFNVEILDDKNHWTTHNFTSATPYSTTNNPDSVNVEPHYQGIMIPQVMGFSLKYSAAGSNESSTTGGVLSKVGLVFMERNKYGDGSHPNNSKKNKAIVIVPKKSIGGHHMGETDNLVSDAWQHVSYVWSSDQWATLQSKLNPNSDERSLVCIGVMIENRFFKKKTSIVTMRIKLYDFNFICGDSPDALKSGTAWSYEKYPLMICNNYDASKFRDGLDSSKHTNKGIVTYNADESQGY